MESKNRSKQTDRQTDRLTRSLAWSEMSSHSGLTNSYLPSMMLRSSISCFRCQKGGNPAKLSGKKEEGRGEKIHVLKLVRTGQEIPTNFYSTLLYFEGGRGGGGKKRGGLERERK